MQPPSNKVHQVLEWYMSIGVDCFLGPDPIDRTKSLAPVITQQQPKPVSITGPLSTSLEELRRVYEAYDICPLKKTASTTVFGDGNPQSGVMLIGEAPGTEEDRSGIPFVGPSGELLDKMLAAIGLDRTTVYITNLLPWRPPGNRSPSAAEIEACLPLLIPHIELVRPKIIVFLGGAAAKALLNKEEGIMKLRGKWMPWTSPDQSLTVETMPLFHPAFLLRTPTQKRRAWQDLLNLKAKLIAAGILDA